MATDYKSTVQYLNKMSTEGWHVKDLVASVLCGLNDAIELAIDPKFDVQTEETVDLKGILNALKDWSDLNCEAKDKTMVHSRVDKILALL